MCYLNMYYNNLIIVKWVKMFTLTSSVSYKLKNYLFMGYIVVLVVVNI